MYVYVEVPTWDTGRWFNKAVPMMISADHHPRGTPCPSQSPQCAGTWPWSPPQSRESPHRRAAPPQYAHCEQASLSTLKYIFSCCYGKFFSYLRHCYSGTKWLRCWRQKCQYLRFSIYAVVPCQFPNQRPRKVIKYEGTGFSVIPWGCLHLCKSRRHWWEA